MFYRNFAAVLAIGCLVWCGIAFGHDDPEAPVPKVSAHRVHAPLIVDGALTEPFWNEIPPVSGMIDQRTHERADEQTTIRVAYTDTHLYIGVECFDEKMDEIRASERREDRFFQGDDWVEIHFDPGHTHRAKYAFFTNPLGTRADANEGPSGVFNYGWSAEWDLAVQLYPDRWTFEMRIPFGVMNYERKDDQVWGINVTRVLRRTDTTSFLSFNATEVYKPRHFGHLTDLDLASTQFDRNWEFTPYVSSRVDFNGETDLFVQSGLDISFRLTPSITTAWAINPDFGHVEADDDTIELRDTERFLPEKRLFFREGDELLRMPHRLYYSRRFAEIDAAAKASGQWNGYSFALLNLQGDITHDGTRYGNSSVFRLQQNVREKSSILYYVADSEFEGGHSRVLSADGYFFITDAWRYAFQASVADDRLSDEQDHEIKDRTDFLGQSSLIYELYPWSFRLGYQAITEQFNPILGFIPRRNIFGPTFLGEYGRDSEEGWYKRLRLYYYTQYFENDSGRTSIRDHSLGGNVVFHNDLGLRIGRDQDFHAPYYNHRTRAAVELFASDFWRSIEVGWAGGEFEKTDYHEVRFEKPFKPFERLPIRYEFTIRFEDRPTGEEAVVWLNRVVFDLFFTDTMWVKTSLQHRGGQVHNISAIYGWEFRPKTHWYFVYNNVNDGTGEAHSVFTKWTKTF